MNANPQIFQFNTNMAPDTEFEPGELHHLVSGNSGRMLDPRRTPVRIVSLLFDTGMCEVEVLDFEDKGAKWLLPFEVIERRYQFAKGSARADADEVAAFGKTVERFDRSMNISCDERIAQQTRAKLAVQRQHAASWMAQNSRFFTSGQSLNPAALDGPPSLFQDLQAFLQSHGLSEIEEKFATQWASHSEAGEFIKAHRIVIAELGLSPYQGKILRDPTIFDPPWSKAERARHLLARMGFVQEVFSRAGIENPILYRTVSSDGPLKPTNRERGLISATFSRQVAEALFADHDTTRTIVLHRQPVPLRRVFMTHLETEQLNHPFKEAEAVLITDPDNLAF